MIYDTSSPLFASFLSVKPKTGPSYQSGGKQQNIKAKGSDGKYQGE